MMTGCGQRPDHPPSERPVLEAFGDLPDEVSSPSTATLIADDGQASEVGFISIDDQIERGRVVYQRQCGACHSLDHNRVGPRHRGVIGRAAGSVQNYRYSAALQSLDLVWSRAALDAWLENPSALAPGTAMGFRLRKAEDRAAVIAYLGSTSP